MKKVLLLFALFSVLIVNAQEEISFPDSFKLDSKLLNGMVLAKIPEDLQAKGIIGNPAVTENKDVIKQITEIDSDDILQVYYQIYNTVEEDDSDDAGVIVSQFVSEEALKNILGKLKDQSNLAYLINDNYLIQVWSDISNDNRKQIMEMVNYYQNKLGAEFYVAPEDEDAVESVSATSTVEPEEPVQSY